MPRTVTLSTHDGDMGLYEAEPDGEARGGIVVIQEAFGVNAHIEDVTQRFAAEGYRAVAPHVFHRTGDPVIAYDDFEKIMPNFAALSEKAILDDVDAALEYLEGTGLPLARVGVVGFCMGGTVAFLVSVRRPVGAGVTFYGGGISQGRLGMESQLDMAGALQAPWLGLYGDKDQGIPIGDVEALRTAVAKADVDAEVVRYADADHGFHCDARASYHQPSATDAWGRTLAWFARYLPS